MVNHNLGMLGFKIVKIQGWLIELKALQHLFKQFSFYQFVYKNACLYFLNSKYI